MKESLKKSKVVFVVLPEVQLLDINGPIQVFYEANELGALFDLHYVSPFQNESETISAAGLKFSGLANFNEIELEPDGYIFIPGITFYLFSDYNFMGKSEAFLKWLQTQNYKDVNICSVCTGAFLLGESGILNDKYCTTHWQRTDELEKKYPKIKLLKNRLFVVDGNVYSSAGVASGIDLSLHIIEKELGPKFAVDVAKSMVVYFRRGESDSQISAYLEYRNHMENRIHEAQSFILNNIEKPITTGDIAEEVNMSDRNLSRLFKKTTGVTIGLYREKLRVERASQLLTEKNTVVAVANACGLRSANQLRVLLKKHKGILPTQI